MLSILKEWLAISRNTWRRDLRVLVLAAFAATVAGCGGAPAATAQCGTSKQCYAEAGFYQKGSDFTQTPHGVFVTMDVAQLTCDSNCLNEYGWISNYVLLGASNLDNWVQLGYSTEYSPYYSPGDPHTFDYYTERAVNNMVTTLYFDEGNPADIGQEANFMVHTLVMGGQNYYYVSYVAPNSTERLLLDPTPATFAPGAAEIGEVLHGGHGEAADSATYSAFNYSPSDLTSLPASAEPASNFPLEFLGMGHVANDQPPYGVWVGFEGNPAVWFQTWCC